MVESSVSRLILGHGIEPIILFGNDFEHLAIVLHGLGAFRLRSRRQLSPRGGGGHRCTEPGLSAVVEGRGRRRASAVVMRQVF